MDRFISGNLGVQVVTSTKNDKLIDEIKKQGYGISVVDIKGRYDKKDKYMLFIEIDKKDISHLKNMIKKIDEKAFIVVNETKYVQNGYFK